MAFAAVINIAYSTPNMHLLESFGEVDVDWRSDPLKGAEPAE
jgi:hypothetical protein